MWWALITTLTIGYGDVVPQSVAGKIISASLMLFGAVTMTMPVLSIVLRFELYYDKNVSEVESDSTEVQPSISTEKYERNIDEVSMTTEETVIENPYYERNVDEEMSCRTVTMTDMVVEDI